jgi:hypothetical protein
MEHELDEAPIPPGKHDREVVSRKRTLIFTGPRAWVEATLGRSLTKGKHLFGPGTIEVADEMVSDDAPGPCP